MKQKRIEGGLKMVIDFHTHVFPEDIAARTIAELEGKAGIRAAADGTVEGLLEAMENTGVDLSLVMPVVTRPQQFDRVNYFAAHLNAQYGGRLLSFGGIHPDCEDYKGKLDRIKDMGMCGIKIHPDYQGVMIDDVRYMNIIEYADSLGMIILTHAGMDIGLPEPIHCPPDRMRRVLDTLKPAKMVAGHYGGWNQWEEVYEYLAGENVYLDTAFAFGYIDQDLFLKILKKHDRDKVLFATDAPWQDTKQYIDTVKALPLEEGHIEDILCNNAKKLLKME